MFFKVAKSLAKKPNVFIKGIITSLDGILP